MLLTTRVASEQTPNSTPRKFTLTMRTQHTRTHAQNEQSNRSEIALTQTRYENTNTHTCHKQQQQHGNKVFIMSTH